METEVFYVKTQIKKNHGEEGENSLKYLEVTMVLWSTILLTTFWILFFSMNLQVHKYPVVL